MSELPRDRALAGAIARAAAEGSSGIVSASRGKLKRVFCLENGFLIYATSNVLEEQFAESLVRRGVLSASARAAAEQACREAGGKLGTTLLEGGFAPAEALRSTMEAQVDALLSSCLEWADGSISFAVGRPRLEGEITVRLAPVPLILRHARRFPASLDALKVRIGPPDLRPDRVESCAALASSLETEEVARRVLERCDGTLTTGEMAGASADGEEATLRAIYGLLLAGMIAPAEGRAASSAAAEPPLSRDEVEARLNLAAGADHYAVLGIERTSSRERVRDVYYALARRYHPDRFRSGPLKDLLGRVEQYFTMVTEAYNTLWHPDLRAEYDQAGVPAAPDASAAHGGDRAHVARQNYLRGRQLVERRHYSEALTFLENAIRLDDAVAEYHLELGSLLASTPRRRDDAEDHLLAAARLDPAKAPAYLALGRLYQRSGRKGEAVHMFREALRWEPENAEASAAILEIGEVEGEPARSRARRGIFKG